MKWLHRVSVVAAIGATAFAVVGSTAQAQVVVGRRAPDFALPDLYGRSVSLSEARGRVVLLAFFKST